MSVGGSGMGGPGSGTRTQQLIDGCPAALVACTYCALVYWQISGGLFPTEWFANSRLLALIFMYAHSFTQLVNLNTSVGSKFTVHCALAEL
eukprot:10441131-Ditylum_brightwellii.AAC.1